MKNLKFLTTLLIVGCVLGSIYAVMDGETASGKFKVSKASLKPKQQEGHIMMTPKDIKYMDGPESLPPNAKAAVIEGDLSKAGPFTVRLQFPANYAIPPHIHPAIEHVTVLEGDLYFGVGEKMDRKVAKKMPMGSIIVMPVGHKHFVYTMDKPATVQLHGIGPWGITYLNPSDDPRNKAKK